MHSNANVSRIKRKFHQFSRTASVMDLRSAEETRRQRCIRHARKHKTEGRKAVFS